MEHMGSLAQARDDSNEKSQNMSYNQNYKGKRNQNQQTILEIIVIGLFKALWWLVSLPFKGIKFGVNKVGMSLEDRNYVVTKRHQIESMLNTNSEIELKHLVIEADKLVDYVLKAQGYSGETFADRLREAQSSVNQNLYNEIWQGHKVRNQIAHENEYQISNIELSAAANKLLEYTKAI